MPYEPSFDTPDSRSGDYAVARTIAIAAALLLVVFLVVGRSRAAFSGVTATGTNHVTTGNITLTDNDSGVAMFHNVAGLVPGNTLVRCIVVTYTGTANPGPVKLYGAVSSQTNALGSSIDIGIEEGVWAGAADTYPGCTNFSGSTLYATDTVTAFTTAHTNHSTGLTGWDPAASSEFRVYRVTLTVLPSALPNSDLSFSLTWEAQS